MNNNLHRKNKIEFYQIKKVQTLKVQLKIKISIKFKWNCNKINYKTTMKLKKFKYKPTNKWINLFKKKYLPHKTSRKS